MKKSISKELILLVLTLAGLIYLGSLYSYSFAQEGETFDIEGNESSSIVVVNQRNINDIFSEISTEDYLIIQKEIEKYRQPSLLASKYAQLYDACKNFIR